MTKVLHRKSEASVKDICENVLMMIILWSGVEIGGDVMVTPMDEVDPSMILHIDLCFW